MKWYHWTIIATATIFALYGAFIHYAAWRRERDSFVRNERLNRFNVSAFRGTRKFDDPRWPS